MKIAASILAADFSCLREEITAVERAGVDLFHLDIMDGSFVPNISFGPMVVETVNRLTDLPLHVHLMIQRPDLYARQFALSGADAIIIHCEARASVEKTLRQIRGLECRVGLSLNPSTPTSILEPFLGQLDEVLLMSVNPGFGGQKFIDSVAEKIAQLRATLDRLGLGHVEIAVDGGVNPDTAPLAIENGAQILVAGSAIFGSDDYPGVVSQLRGKGRTGSCSRS